jgi:hypothetical protein
LAGQVGGLAGADLAGLAEQAQAAASATISAVLQQLPNLEHVHPLLSKHPKLVGEHLALTAGNAPFESILDLELDGPDKLLVEVLEAKELRPIVQGKTENVFCQIYLKSKDNVSGLRSVLGSSSQASRQNQRTYVVEDTLDPTWHGQRFLFTVKQKAVSEPRLYRLRVKVFLPYNNPRHAHSDNTHALSTHALLCPAL